jgi:hypothetical protein
MIKGDYPHVMNVLCMNEILNCTVKKTGKVLGSKVIYDKGFVRYD